jgi:hypothetical protein
MVVAVKVRGYRLKNENYINRLRVASDPPLLYICGAWRNPLCNNGPLDAGTDSSGTAMLNVHMTQGKRFLLWLILATLAALVTYLAFRAYISPELLLNFSNTFAC